MARKRRDAPAETSKPATGGWGYEDAAPAGFGWVAPSLVKRGKERVQDLTPSPDGDGWQIKGRGSKFGDHYEQYHVVFRAGEKGPRHYCSCQTHAGGEYRSICSHIMAVIWWKTQHGIKINSGGPAVDVLAHVPEAPRHENFGDGHGAEESPSPPAFSAAETDAPACPSMVERPEPSPPLVVLAADPVEVGHVRGAVVGTVAGSSVDMADRDAAGSAAGGNSQQSGETYPLTVAWECPGIPHPTRWSLPSWVQEIRPHQWEAVKQAVRAYLLGRRRFVLIDAPTGSGKTLLAVIIVQELRLSAALLGIDLYPDAEADEPGGEAA